MTDELPQCFPGTAELAQPEAATCMHCLKPFTRLPKSIAAYCSPKCRSEAKDRAEAVKREEQAAPLNAILNAGPPEVTDISVITYREYQIAWTQVDGNSSENGERTFAVRSFGSLPNHVRMALVENAQDLIPEEVMAFAPDNPMRAIQDYSSHPWWQEVVTSDPINKEDHK